MPSEVLVLKLININLLKANLDKQSDAPQRIPANNSETQLIMFCALAKIFHNLQLIKVTTGAYDKLHVDWPSRNGKMFDSRSISVTT